MRLICPQNTEMPAAIFIIADNEFTSKNLVVIDSLPFSTSGHAGIETETFLEQSAESCGQMNLPDAEHAKRRVH